MTTRGSPRALYSVMSFPVATNTCLAVDSTVLNPGNRTLSSMHQLHLAAWLILHPRSHVECSTAALLAVGY